MSILPAMSDQNPNLNALPANCPCGSPACPARGAAGLYVNGDSITARTIDASQLFAGLVTAPKVELPLTVKQAAKAYRKAVRAHEAAVTAHKDAQKAEAAARSAVARASTARQDAQDALEKAATQ